MTKEEFSVFSETPEGKALIAPIVDRAVTRAIGTFKAGHALPAEVTARLDAAEKVLGVMEGELKKERLAHFAFRECIRTRVDPALLEGYPLTDEETITAKVNQLAKIGENAALAARNELMAGSYKPGAGATSSERRPDLRTMGRQEMELRERMGTLDGLLGK